MEIEHEYDGEQGDVSLMATRGTYVMVVCALSDVRTGRTVSPVCRPFLIPTLKKVTPQQSRFILVVTVT